jgi:endonuclease/exonuclease/phosphatase family metal-dependent hydrolase
MSDNAIRCCTVNIGTGELEMKHESLVTRWPRQMKLLEDQRPDVLCLQELTRFSPDKKEVQPEDILYDISKKLSMQTTYCSLRPAASTTAFGQAICWRHDKFFLKQTVQKWLGRDGELSDIPAGTCTATSTTKGFSSMILAVELCFINEKKLGWLPNRTADSTGSGFIPSFWVVNVHLPTDQAVRLTCTKSINTFLSSLSSPCIVMGDFNTVPADSKEQLSLLDTPNRQRVITLKTLDGTPVPGTWCGYPADKWCRTIKDMPHFDHIIISQPTTVETETKTATLKPGGVQFTLVYEGIVLAHDDDINKHTTPSDHLGLFAIVHAILD